MRVITTPAAMQHGGGDPAVEAADTYAGDARVQKQPSYATQQ